MLYYNYNVVALIVEQLSESSTISKSAVPVCHPGVASSMLFLHLGRSSASRFSRRRNASIHSRILLRFDANLCRLAVPQMRRLWPTGRPTLRAGALWPTRTRASAESHA